MNTLVIGIMGIVLKKTPGINSKFSNNKQKYKTQLQSLSLNFPFNYIFYASCKWHGICNKLFPYNFVKKAVSSFYLSN